MEVIRVQFQLNNNLKDMEKFKINIFKAENKNRSFPHFQKESKKTCTLFKSFFSKKTGLNENETDSIKILKCIRTKSKLLPEINAESEDFNFKLLINKLALFEPQNININWNRFDNIDKLKLIDFSNYFKYIWYPGPDDIEVFPDDVSWIISIDATGHISVMD